MFNHKKIVLIGPMGAGKTSLGKRLAQQLNWDFIDTDQVICQKTGVDIPTIFSTEGENGFRRRETDALRDVLQREGNSIVACGGGIILKPENRRMLCTQYLVIFLDISVEEQISRVGKDKNRPLMQNPNLEQHLNNLRDERLAFYIGLADLRFESEGSSFNILFQKLQKSVLKWMKDN